MARVARGKALALEDVPQVRAAGSAGDLGARAIGIGRAPHRAGDLLVEARPAAA